MRSGDFDGFNAIMGRATGETAFSYITNKLSEAGVGEAVQPTDVTLPMSSTDFSSASAARLPTVENDHTAAALSNSHLNDLSWPRSRFILGRMRHLAASVPDPGALSPAAAAATPAQWHAQAQEDLPFVLESLRHVTSTM